MISRVASRFPGLANFVVRQICRFPFLKEEVDMFMGLASAQSIEENFNFISLVQENLTPRGSRVFLKLKRALEERNSHLN